MLELLVGNIDLPGLPFGELPAVQQTAAEIIEHRLRSTLRLFEADRLSSEGHPSGCRRPVVHSSPIQNSSFVEM
jgi:hypothetical protein